MPPVRVGRDDLATGAVGSARNIGNGRRALIDRTEPSIRRDIAPAGVQSPQLGGVRGELAGATTVNNARKLAYAGQTKRRSAATCAV
jgi:hypothetical protein